MIKMMILAPRNATMTHAQFRDYVVGVHGPLVKSITEVAEGIKRYHYNFPVAGYSDDVFGHPLAAQFDIFTQAWFESLEAHRGNQKHPRYMAVIRPDEEVMADNANARFHYTREHEIVAGELGENKVFLVHRRRADLTRATFQEAWHARMTEAVVGSAAFGSAIARYVQNHALPEADHPADPEGKYYDVIDEFAVRSLDDWNVLANDADLVSRIKTIERELLDTSRTLSYFAETVRNIDGPVS